MPQITTPLPEVTDYHYSFYNHFHPYVGYLIQKLNKGELEDLLSFQTQQQSDSFFSTEYDVNPLNDPNVIVNYFDKEIDFEVEGPYAIYNWELFYFIPLSIAIQLTKSQRFADAQRWFHFIFNPLTDDPEDSNNPTARFWNFLPFRDSSDAKKITELLENLSLPPGDPSLDLLRERLIKSIAAWRHFPFSAHNVAKFRPLAYQFHVVMKYLDMLIAWGDSYFMRFTIEDNNIATQKYIIAKNILGPRPEEVPRLSKRPIRNYKQLKNRLDAFGNALVEMENEFPLNNNVVSSGSVIQDTSLTSLLGIGKQLFFCVPHNKQLMAYWDTIEDRLFKIRNCMDIEGNVRQIPLFQPPIDPGMLVKAAAGGLSISDIVGGLNQPVSNVRFSVIFQKASELCNEVRSTGNTLLSIIEKGEAEKLSQIRQSHEIKILELAQDFKYLQWKEAEASTEALLKSRETAFQRYRHFQLLLGKEDGDFAELSELTIERNDITEENFDEVYSDLVGKYGQLINLEEYKEEKLGLLGEVSSRISNITGFTDSVLGVGNSDYLQLSKMEDIELNVLMPMATNTAIFGLGMSTASNLLGLIPQFGIKFEPMGVGGDSGFGGVQLSKAVDAVSSVIQKGAGILADQSQRAAKLASYHRRIGDWVNANNQASKELEQIGRQLITSLIREQYLKKDYENHKVQIEQSKTIDDFIKVQKFSNEELYLWMQGELSKVYYESYKLAFDTAKKAESTMKYELMRKELDERNFIKFNYWDSGHKGLLSGEGLYMDLKRMELAYLESNKREFELTKHISIQRLDPLALLELKTTGSCTIDIPEWLFDLDCPGHYFRRIKTVSVSIPAVSGPYTSINCTLSLQKSSIRKSSLLSDGAYERDNNGDERFIDYFGATQSIVTSNAQNDSGMFEVNMREERFLPFENSGAISTWRLELPGDLKQFDYNKITDVILHMRYTARQGGQTLGAPATAAIETMMSDTDKYNLVRLFNVKQEFPNEWHQYVTSSLSSFKFILKKEHFPYLVQPFDLNLFNDGTDFKVKVLEVGNGGSASSTAISTYVESDFNTNGESTIEIALDKTKDWYLAIEYKVVF